MDSNKLQSTHSLETQEDSQLVEATPSALENIREEYMLESEEFETELANTFKQFGENSSDYLMKKKEILESVHSELDVSRLTSQVILRNIGGAHATLNFQMSEEFDQINQLKHKISNYCNFSEQFRERTKMIYEIKSQTTK